MLYLHQKLVKHVLYLLDEILSVLRCYMQSYGVVNLEVLPHFQKQLDFGQIFSPLTIPNIRLLQILKM